MTEGQRTPPGATPVQYGPAELPDDQMRSSRARKVKQAVMSRKGSHYVILYLQLDEITEVLAACDKHRKELLKEAFKAKPADRKKMSKTIRGIIYACLQLRQAMVDIRAEEAREKDNAR